jgi:hypothetical protein
LLHGKKPELATHPSIPAPSSPHQQP